MQRVLIIGATSAIAEATARLLSARGASLFLTGRDRQRLEAIAADLLVRGAHTVDIANLEANDLESHARVLDDAWEKLGEVDIDGHSGELTGRLREQDRTVLYTKVLQPGLVRQWPDGRFRAGLTSPVIVGIGFDGIGHRKSNKRYGTMLLPVSHKAFVITQHRSFTVAT